LFAATIEPKLVRRQPRIFASSATAASVIVNNKTNLHFAVDVVPVEPDHPLQPAAKAL
jgi:hypothetical protein